MPEPARSVQEEFRVRREALRRKMRSGYLIIGLMLFTMMGLFVVGLLADKAGRGTGIMRMIPILAPLWTVVFAMLYKGIRKDWLCPACNQSLGNQTDPKACPSCKVSFEA